MKNRGFKSPFLFVIQWFDGMRCEFMTKQSAFRDIFKMPAVLNMPANRRAKISDAGLKTVQSRFMGAENTRRAERKPVAGLSRLAGRLACRCS